LIGSKPIKGESVLETHIDISVRGPQLPDRALNALLYAVLQPCSRKNLRPLDHKNLFWVIMKYAFNACFDPWAVNGIR
jgi:hypothetical protein